MQILELVLEHAQAGSPLAGSLFWSAIGSQSGHSDDFSVHLARPAVPSPILEGCTPSQLNRDQEQGNSQTCEIPSKGDAAPMMPESSTAESTVGDVPMDMKRVAQYLKEAVWLDERVVDVLRSHAKSLAALNSSWGECPLM